MGVLGWRFLYILPSWGMTTEMLCWCVFEYRLYVNYQCGCVLYLAFLVIILEVSLIILSWGTCWSVRCSSRYEFRLHLSADNGAVFGHLSRRRVSQSLGRCYVGVISELDRSCDDPGKRSWPDLRLTPNCRFSWRLDRYGYLFWFSEPRTRVGKRPL